MALILGPTAFADGQASKKLMFTKEMLCFAEVDAGSALPLEDEMSVRTNDKAGIETLFDDREKEQKLGLLVL